MAKSKNSKQSNITIVRKMRDYSNEPAFVAATEKAKAFLKKHGLPKAFKKRAK